MRRSSLLLAAIILASYVGRAQTDPTLAQGLIPYESYQGGEIDNVNLSNGSLNVHIPLIGYPQRGNGLKLGFSLNYNGMGIAREYVCSTVDTTQICTNEWTESLPTGMEFPNGNLLTEVATADQFALMDDQSVRAGLYRYTFDYGGNQEYREIVEWVTSDGAVHHGVLAGSNPLGTGQISVDGTGFYVPMSWSGCTVSCPTTDANGISYYPFPSASQPTLREDSNGNVISLQYGAGAGEPATAYEDTVGRTIPLPTSTTDYSGCSGSLPTSSASVWQAPGVNGSTLTYKFCYAQVTICIPGLSGECGTSNTYTYLGFQTTESLLQSVVLPNNQTWTFVYSSRNAGDPVTVNYGDLSEIISPTGGTFSYQYSIYTGPVNATYSTSVVSRTVDANDGTGPHIWTYAAMRGVPSGPVSQMTVTDPMGEQTVHLFGGYPYETGTQFYSGTAGSSTLLKTVTQAYTLSGPVNPDTKYPIGAFPSTATTTLGSQATSQVTTQYCCAVSYLGVDGVSFTNGSGTYGLPTNVMNYDYGAGSPGALLRNDQTTYEWQNDNAYFTANLLNLVAQKATYSGSGSLLAQANYTYDESAYLTGSGINTQHGAPVSALRGNPTTTTNSSVTGPSLISHTNWYDTGEVYKSIDSAGNTTTYSYSGTYAGSLPTQVTNALGQATNATYDLSTGLLTGVQDPNAVAQGRVGNIYSYNDPLDRLTLIDNAVGALDASGASAESKTAYSYPSATEVDAAQDQSATGDVALKSRTFYDGLGRTIGTVGPDGAIVRTGYDGLGRVCAVSNRTFSNPGPLSCTVGSNPPPASPTDGYTYFTYDSLSRPNLQTQPDGTTLQWGYNGNVVDFYDEDNSHWQRTSDALGRLTKVLENDPAGSGQLTLETDYGYDGLGNLTSANQKGASGDTPRARSFSYDGLSRLMSASNPETGTVTYSYANTGGPCSGDPSSVCSRTDARGVTTNYSYDALNRIATKSYANDPANTPTLVYSYDIEYPFQLVDNEDNPIGHLGNIEAELGTTPIVTWANEDYDQRGKILGYLNCIDEDAPTCNNNYVTDDGNATAYYYNLAEELGWISEDSCMGACTQSPLGAALYTYDNGGRLTSIATQVELPSQSGFFTTTAFSSPTYNALGQITNASLAPGSTGTAAIALSRTYDNRGRRTGEIDANPQMQPVYNYSVNYDGNGNVTGFNDSANGTFALVNDSLHRLISGSVSSGPSAGTNFGEVYDHFGNRNQEMIMAGSANESSTYLNFTQGDNRVDGYTYDAAGNLLDDGVNRYWYDGEERLCAVKEYSTGGGLVGYVYGPDGTRLAKGTLSSFSCDLTKNNFSTTNLYTVGPSGEELQEIDGNSNLIHFNVFLQGELLGTFAGTTYSAANWEYALNDWVGTKRVIANYDGSTSTSFFSGPFGDYLENQGPGADPSEQHFTGKDRDQESGNDYFTARYYNSNMGRFLSPDPSQLDYADQTNPQSLNLYSYAWNNPLRNVDPTGMYCFYGGQGDTPENDSDSTDYDFGATSSSDCGSGGQWIDNPSTTVTVNGDTGESDSISTFPTDTNATIQRSFTRQFPCAQSASSTIGNLEGNFPKNADWQKGPLHVTFLQRGQLQQGGVIPIDGPVGAWAANGSPAGFMHAGTSAVSVTSVGSNSFTFTTVPGMHPFDNGSVSFSASGAGNGNINFSVDVNAQFANSASQFIFNNLGGSAMEASIWHNLINNVQAGCHN